MNRLHPTETNLRLFLMLDAVLTEGNVTRAAEQLGITQSAVSHGLRRLRAYYKDPLLVRSGSGMRPTPLASNLLPHIRLVIRELDAVLRERGAFDPAQSTRTFTLTTVDYPFAIGLDSLFPVFLAKAPKARLVIRPPGQRLTEELETGVSELILGSINIELALRQDDQLMRQRVVTERLCCLMRADHPILAAPLTMEALLDQPQVVVNGSGRQDGPLRQLLAPYVAEFRETFQIPHFLALPMVLAGTDAVAIVPNGMVAYAQRVAPLVARELPMPDPPSASGYLWWHRRMHADPGHIWFREQVAELMARDIGRA